MDSKVQVAVITAFLAVQALVFKPEHFVRLRARRDLDVSATIEQDWGQQRDPSGRSAPDDALDQRVTW